MLALTATACTTNRQIRDAVRHFDNLELDENQVKVLSTQQMGDHMVAEIEIRTAVKMTRQPGGWKIEEVRIGDRRWERADHIRNALNLERENTSRRELHRVSDALRRFGEQNAGHMPEAEDFGELMSILTPEYLVPVIRIDAWSNPYLYRRLSPSLAEVLSVGADGQAGTADDLVERIGE
jgi:hypothetical protein